MAGFGSGGQGPWAELRAAELRERHRHLVQNADHHRMPQVQLSAARVIGALAGIVLGTAGLIAAFVFLTS